MEDENKSQKLNNEKATTEKIRVIIADDEGDCSEEIKINLSKYDEIEILGIARTDEEEIRLINRLKPDIVITDLKRNDDFTGFYIIKEYENKYERLKFLIVSYAKESLIFKRKNIIGFVEKYPKIDFEKVLYLLRKGKNEINDALKKAEKMSCKQKHFSIYSYLDYIRNMEKMDVPITKKILFPENFDEAHDENVRKVKVVENKGTEKKIKQRYKELQKNIYSNNVYIIRPARDLKDMKDEAKQQENCVYKNYSESYAFGDTDIYFMRNINNPNQFLVTVEVLENKIRQKYQKKNKYVTEEQEKFLKKWEKEVLKVA